MAGLLNQWPTVPTLVLLGRLSFLLKRRLMCAYVAEPTLSPLM